MTKELTKTQEEILRLYTSGEDLKNTEITEQVGCSESTTSTTIKKFERDVLPHPDKEFVDMDADFLEEEDWVDFAKFKMDQGGRGLKVARNILDNLPEDSFEGGDATPNL